MNRAHSSVFRALLVTLPLAGAAAVLSRAKRRRRTRERLLRRSSPRRRLSTSTVALSTGGTALWFYRDGRRWNFYRDEPQPLRGLREGETGDIAPATCTTADRWYRPPREEARVVQPGGPVQRRTKGILMLRSLKLLEHYKVKATDGDSGSVTNFLLDDQRWTVRYLVVETGGIFGGRQVLISPISFRNVDFLRQVFPPGSHHGQDQEQPERRSGQAGVTSGRARLLRLLRLPYYWGHGALWGSGYYPGAMAGAGYDRSGERPGEPDADVHLRSAKEVTGYHIEGTDGAIGHVKDFMLDDESWAIQYMVIETSNWWVGKSVLIAPQWTSRISWLDRKVYVDMTRAAIKNSPQWESTTRSAGLTRRHSTVTMTGSPSGEAVTPRPPRQAPLPIVTDRAAQGCADRRASLRAVEMRGPVNIEADHDPAVWWPRLWRSSRGS